MSTRPLRVVKVGGSLLTVQQLEEALRMWLAEQPQGTNVLLVGGGAAADAVREASRRTELSDEESHWLAMGAMDQSTNGMQSLFPEAVAVQSLAEIRAADCGELLIIRPSALLRQESIELGPERLPHSWSVSSDSIAARIAEAVDADELVLLKSCPRPPVRSWQEAADAGYVDTYFPLAIARLRHVRAVNLREGRSSLPDRTLQPGMHC
jgi:aspartokinase-like uncharacterized kinase